MIAVEQRSPFHAGELEVQHLVGVDERIVDIGQRVIRDHLLPQHQEFYQSQHQLLPSVVDGNGRSTAVRDLIVLEEYAPPGRPGGAGGEAITDASATLVSRICTAC